MSSVKPKLQPMQPSRDNQPRFQQIISHIRQQISSGALAEHAMLPSERTVGELFNVSRMTARRALVAIQTEGLAYSSGRRGRFVSPKRLKYDISNMVSFAAGAQSEGLGLTIELISSGLTPADSRLAAALSVEEGEELFEYKRLFKIKGHPAFIEVEYAIACRFPGLLDHDLCQSTTVLMERHYNTCARTGNIVIRMQTLQPDEAELLGLATYQVGIELEQVICDRDGKPFCFGRQLWRGELAEFTAQAVVNGTSAH